MKHATTQSVTCRVCGDIEMVSYVDAKSSQEARTYPSFANRWTRWLGNQSKIMGPAASQNGQTLTVYEWNTEKYSFPVFNPLVRDRILPWTWGPVCTLMITHTHTVNNNCIVTVLQCASGPVLLHTAFMTANDLTQFPIQMIPGAPLSADEARNWSLSLSDVGINSWICIITIPHSVNEAVRLPTGTTLSCTTACFNRASAHSFEPELGFRQARRPIQSVYDTALSTHHCCFNKYLSAFLASLELTSDETRLHGISGLHPIWPPAFTKWSNFGKKFWRGGKCVLWGGDFDTRHVLTSAHAAPTTALQLFAR